MFSGTIAGGVLATMRFLGMVRPLRLLENFQTIIRTGKIPALKFAPSRIQSIKPVGKRYVVDIRTDSHTFVANGFIVHNCGEDSVPYDDFLDAMSRLHEPELGIRFPTGPAADEARAIERNRPRVGSWEAVL